MSVDPAYRLLATHTGEGVPAPGHEAVFEAAGEALVAALVDPEPIALVEALADLLYETARVAVERACPLPWAPRPTPATGGIDRPDDPRHLAEEAGLLVGAAVRALAEEPGGPRVADALDAVARYTHRAAAACGVGLDPFLLDAHRSRLLGDERRTAGVAALLGGRS